MTHETIVVLRILADGEGGAPPWWEAMKLPPPERFEEHFADNVHVSVVLAKEVRRG